MADATRRGLAVVPLGGSDGKKPLLDAWPERGVATLGELARWHRLWPGCNYGILTGRASGLDCLDFDIGGSGLLLMVVWRLLEVRIGPIPHTWAVASGNGLHVYVRHVPGAQSRQRLFGLPVDFLADGRQVVGPGSVHPNGSIYTELDPAVAVAALPEPGRFLQALAGAGPAGERDRDGGAGPQEPPKRRLLVPRHLPAATALGRAVDAIAGAGEGRRNDTLNRVVYFLGPYMATGLLERPSVEDACGEAALGAGLEAREVSATLRSACGDGIRDSAPGPAHNVVPDRSCSQVPFTPPRSLTRATRRRYQPLQAWERSELTPALACIWRTLQASSWAWHGATLDRAIFEHLLGVAQAQGTSLQIEASLRYLSGVTGRHTKYVADALRRLQEHGWLALARQGGPTGQGSVRAPSAFQLRIPAHLAVPAPEYARPPRAHQLKKLSIGGSRQFHASDYGGFRLGSFPTPPPHLPRPVSPPAAARGQWGGGWWPEGICREEELVQERLGGDDLEIWALATEMPVAAGKEAPRSGRGRATRCGSGRDQKKSRRPHLHHRSPAGYGAGGRSLRGPGDEDLAAALEAIRMAGLEPEVCSW